jgi:hypothetical protein
MTPARFNSVRNLHVMSAQILTKYLCLSENTSCLFSPSASYIVALNICMMLASGVCIEIQTMFMSPGYRHSTFTAGAEQQRSLWWNTEVQATTAVRAAKLSRQLLHTVVYWRMTPSILGLTLGTVRRIYWTGTPLPSKQTILYIFSTNIRTEFFSHAAYSLFYSL